VPISQIFQDLVPLDLPLESIFLDPNNPRFVGPNWQQVEDVNTDSEAIQENARMLMVRDYGVDKLRMNMEVNGYLPIDRVIVRWSASCSDDSYRASRKSHKYGNMGR
jgi:hypothetical protein